MVAKPRLWTRGFVLDTLVNFLIYIIYYMLMVIIASEAIHSLNASVSEAGLASRASTRLWAWEPSAVQPCTGCCTPSAGRTERKKKKKRWKKRKRKTEAACCSLRFLSYLV